MSNTYLMLHKPNGVVDSKQGQEDLNGYGLTLNPSRPSLFTQLVDWIEIRQEGSPNR